MGRLEMHVIKLYY